MKKNVKTTGRVRKLAIVASKIVGHKIELYECADGKSFQIIEHTAAGQVVWPLHVITIREAGLALELLITVAPSIIKTGVMGFTLSAYEIHKHEAEKHFDTTLANIKTLAELMECLRSMLMELEKTTIVGGPSVSAAINRYEYVFTKNGTLVANAVRNIRFLIRAYKELSMPFMIKAYARQIAAWGRPR
jgi:hypothetical protein